MASSSRNQAEGRYTVKHGLSYVKIYKNEKSDEGSSGHHKNDPPPDFMDIDHSSEEERPPYVIVVHGPPKVGKTLLIKCLEDYYSRRNVAGPNRCFLLGDKRRIQFVECPNNVNGMIDAAKYADAVMLLIDAGYGFEMETFEFLELLKVHGMPKVMGVLTYLDSFKNEDVLAKTRQNLLDQFQTNIHNGAKVFCLSGRHNEMYFDHEISELASVISTMDFHHSSWRAARPYLLVDRFEDITPVEEVQMDQECRRDIILEGYLRGCEIENGSKVHIAGIGDFPLANVTSLNDPFPLPSVDATNLKTNTGKVSDFDELSNMETECFRAGTYVRFKFHDVPFKMVKNHDPCQPILVGGVSLEEAKLGYMQAKLEPHSWHIKLLKTKDPIIVSVGWRRYQTRPMYSLKDSRGTNQMLKYTPKNKPCLATFWGPLAPAGTELAVVQSLADNKAAFRILAKASVLEFSHDAEIVKKRKWIGTPHKIFKKTALIKNMFTSDLEIAFFKNAKIQTLSGISGRINKPAEKDITHGLEGIAKCTFKRKIHKHDTIFMHSYDQVEVPRFFNPLTGGPEPPDRIWHGVVDACELTRASDLCVPADTDSFYKTHINPFDTRDIEFQLRWPRLMVALRRATSEKEKLSIKRQIEDLKIALDERQRERELEDAAPRRQTVQQIRVVRFIENQKTPEDINKLLALLEEDQNPLRLRIEGFIKEFKEYVKGKEGMPTGVVLPASSSAAGFQVNHGTTCLAINNRSGIHYMADGRVTITYPGSREEILTEEFDKIKFLGGRMLVSGAGNGNWCTLFIWIFRQEIERPIATANETAEERGAFWNVETCALFVRWFQNVGFEAPYLAPGSDCSMTFGSYENFQTRMFYAGKDEVHEIFDAELPTRPEDQLCFQSMGGPGCRDAWNVIRRSGINIYEGEDIAEWEEHVIVMLLGMQAACNKDGASGGIIQGYHMSPPLGATERVHIGPVTRIPLDIQKLRADMYYRLFTEATEAAACRLADHYHAQFVQASNEYKKTLKAEQKRVRKEQQLLAEQKQQLKEERERFVNFLIRTRRIRRMRRGFKGFRAV